MKVGMTVAVTLLVVGLVGLIIGTAVSAANGLPFAPFGYYFVGLEALGWLTAIATVAISTASEARDFR